MSSRDMSEKAIAWVHPIRKVAFHRLTQVETQARIGRRRVSEKRERAIAPANGQRKSAHCADTILHRCRQRVVQLVAKTDKRTKLTGDDLVIHRAKFTMNSICQDLLFHLLLKSLGDLRQITLSAKSPKDNREFAE